MLLHVWAKPRCAAFKLDLTHEAALHQRIEAIVNRRVRNFRHHALGADKNFLGGGVIALVHEHVIDMLTLRRETKTARAQPFGQVLLGFTVCACAHYEEEV